MLRKSRKAISSYLASRAARALVLASLIALPSGVGTAVAVAAGGDTSAVAINTRDDSFVFRLAFRILQVTGAVIDNENAAVAYASCTACETIAISVQVLLISSDPPTFVPVNEAIAINQDCQECDSLAGAYQFAIAVGARLKFTADGRQQIASIRHQLEMLRQSGLTGPQIDAQVSALMAQLTNVLQTQLIPVSEPAGVATTSSTPAPATPTDTAPASTSTPDTTPPTTSTTTGPTDTTGTTPTSSSTTPTGTGTGTTPTSTSTAPSSADSPSTTTP